MPDEFETESGLVLPGRVGEKLLEEYQPDLRARFGLPHPGEFTTCGMALNALEAEAFAEMRDRWDDEAVLATLEGNPKRGWYLQTWAGTGVAPAEGEER